MTASPALTAYTSDTYDAAILSQELTRDEGSEAEMYQDEFGNWSIGIGHNLSIPQSEFVIQALFQCDCNGAEASLDAHWPWWRKLDAVRQRVMMNMMFNLGSGRLAGFSKFLAAMEAGDWQEAAVQMQDSEWWTQVGERAERLQYMVLNGAVQPGTV